GKKYVRGGFRTHVARGTVVQETQTTRLSMNRWFTTKQAQTSISVRLICYKGKKTDVKWVDEDPLHFETLCSFSASIPASALIPGSRLGAIKPCWSCNFDAVVSFGTTEFKCKIEWKDSQGITQSGVAVPVWNEG
ncbi:hypothetical protein FRC02_000826, partial [Tulasnella sp. 418]